MEQPPSAQGSSHPGDTHGLETTSGMLLEALMRTHQEDFGCPSKVSRIADPQLCVCLKGKESTSSPLVIPCNVLKAQGLEGRGAGRSLLPSLMLCDNPGMLQAQLLLVPLLSTP